MYQVLNKYARKLKLQKSN